MVQKEIKEKRGNLNDSLYFLYMKSLVESLFDNDLVQKEIPGHQLKDIVFFDGQWVYRLRKGYSKIIIPIEGYDKDNALGVIDWKKVRQDLKKWGGNKINLGLYAYANADEYNIRNTETTKKTEDFARLILTIPYIEEYHFGEFNSRFRDEFIPKLDEYILPQYKQHMKHFYFDINSRSKFGMTVALKYGCESYNFSTFDTEVLRFEFVKNSD